jgi:acid stress-induced BolA-like protein IbaG/YrbA
MEGVSMTEILNLKRYKELEENSYNRIIEFLVANNLNSPLKISSVICKEVKVTGETVQREIVVVEEMFAEEEQVAQQNNQVPEKDEAISEIMKKLESPTFYDTSSTEIGVDKKVIQEVPIGIIKNDFGIPGPEKSKELVNGLRNERDKQGIFRRIANFIR